MTAIPALAVLALLANAPPSTKLYNAVKEAQKCNTSSIVPGQMECDFKMGSLHFAIAAVGSPDAGIAIYKADWDKDYHLSYGVQHGCLIVKWGQKQQTSENAMEMVFVSPATGGVYRTWEECQKAKARK